MGVLTRALRLLPAETAHGLTVRLLSLYGAGRAPADDPRLKVEALGLSFPNPIDRKAHV